MILNSEVLLLYVSIVVRDFKLVLLEEWRWLGEDLACTEVTLV